MTPDQLTFSSRDALPVSYFSGCTDDFSSGPLREHAFSDDGPKFVTSSACVVRLGDWEPFL
jgi:hypothetical protein